MKPISRVLAVALTFSAPLVAWATDAPHDASTNANCEGCHVGHNSTSGAITREDGNFNLCNSCHTDTTRFGFIWNTGDQATPGVGGRSHRWDALASNIGATSPDPASPDATIASMGQHLDGGKLKCTTCHDIHQADVYKGNMNTSVPLNSPASIARVALQSGPMAGIPPAKGTGTGTLELTYVTDTVVAAGWMIAISGPNQFKISHDRGLTFFGYNSALNKWDVDTLAGYTTGKNFVSGTEVTLDDDKTRVRLTGTFDSTPAVDAFQTFYVSWPFLRADNTNSNMCVKCHQDRDMNHIDVEGGAANGLTGGKLTTVNLGTTVFSHPVGVALTRSYDRVSGGVPTVLDADGSLQSAGTETNKTNDYRFGTGNVVHCMTCHHPHNADSNSITQDPR